MITVIGSTAPRRTDSRPPSWPHWQNREQHDDVMQAQLLASFLKEDDQRLSTDNPQR